MQHRIEKPVAGHFNHLSESMNATEMVLGLQPAAHIYDPRSNTTVNGRFACNNNPMNHDANLQHTSSTALHPYVNVYQQFASVPLSAIQPLEHSPYNTCMMNQAIANHQSSAFNFDAQCISPNLPDSPNDSRPGTASSAIRTIHPQPHRGMHPLLDHSRAWSGSMVSLSLHQPYQLHTFMANSDGTISNFAPSPCVAPERIQLSPVEQASLKRSSDDSFEANTRHGGIVDDKGKRRCMEAQGKVCKITPYHFYQINSSVHNTTENHEADANSNLDFPTMAGEHMGDGAAFTSSGIVSANTGPNPTFTTSKETRLSPRHPSS
jgi:hypothetical protein